MDYTYVNQAIINTDYLGYLRLYKLFYLNNPFVLHWWWELRIVRLGNSKLFDWLEIHENFAKSI